MTWLAQLFLSTSPGRNCILFCFCQALSTLCPHVSLLPSEKCLPFQQGQSSQFQRVPGKGSIFQRFASSKVIVRATKQMPSFQILRKKLPQCDIRPKNKNLSVTKLKMMIACLLAHGKTHETWVFQASKPETEENVISLLKS